MINKKILCFCLPTCNKEDMFSYLLPSLKNLKELKDYCTFSITFQPPYTQEDIKECLSVFDDLKLSYKYEYKEYNFESNKIMLMQLRQDCALRYPNSLFYGLLDDDMSFEEGIDNDYLSVLNLMLRDRNISVASLYNEFSMVGEDDGADIPALTQWYSTEIEYLDFENADFSTNNGLVFRGGIFYGFKGLMPEEICKLSGGKQDYTTAVWRILQGDTAIRVKTVHCKHYENRAMPGYVEYNWSSLFEEGTLLYWLRQHQFLRFSDPERWNSIYRNFRKSFCEELYKKGCKSSLSEFVKSLEKIKTTDANIKEIDVLLLGGTYAK